MLVESFSGIRGVYNKDLTEDTARRYAYCYYSFLKERTKNEPKIAVGTDTRQGSAELKKAVIDVFSFVIDVGIATTPAVELAVREYKLDGGVIITASHNEPEWNGFKFLDRDGAVLRPEGIGIVIKRFNKIKSIAERDFLNNYLYKEIKNQRFFKPQTCTKFEQSKIKIHRVEKRHKELINSYCRFLLKALGKRNIGLIRKKRFKIVLDPNGGAAITLKPVFEKIGIKIIEINNKPGEFKRKIEPNAESLAYLKDEIGKNKADLAAGFDCDGDRVEILLPDGKIVSGHYLLAVIAGDILSEIRSPGKKTIVVNDATSNVVKETAEMHNAQVKETEVGEINVLDAMLRNNSPVGGEGSSSGVIIPPSRCRDGALTLLYALKVMAKKAKPLSRILGSYPKYFTLRKAVKFNAKNLQKIREKIKRYYLGKGSIIQEIGGITGSLKIITGKKSFVWFRASKTEADVFRVMADSPSERAARKLLAEGARLIR